MAKDKEEWYVAYDGSSHDSHMSYQLLKRMLSPVLKIMTKKVIESNHPTNIKEAMLKLLKFRPYRFRFFSNVSKNILFEGELLGTVFSGEWKTSAANTLVTLT